MFKKINQTIITNAAEIQQSTMQQKDSKRVMSSQLFYYDTYFAKVMAQIDIKRLFLAALSNTLQKH